VEKATGRRSAAAARAEPPAPIPIPGPGRYPLWSSGAWLVIEANGAAPVAWPLQARTRRAGDRLRPAGGRGGKSLKAWLIDRKVARARRERLLLVADGTGRVLAIPELGVSLEGAEGLSFRVEPPA
jgi:tRNA(Ile)-lysidine synthetase-like protein